MRKHRGLKRYYKRLKTQNYFDKRNIDFETFNNQVWHTHFDWYGYGNNNFKRRKPHLDMLFRHFNILEEKTQNLNQSFYLFAIIFDTHSESDALYFHNTLPDNRYFMFNIDSLSKKSTLKNTTLNSYIEENLNEFETFYGLADEPFCLIFKKNAFIPFTN